MHVILLMPRAVSFGDLRAEREARALVRHNTAGRARRARPSGHRGHARVTRQRAGRECGSAHAFCLAQLGLSRLWIISMAVRLRGPAPNRRGADGKLYSCIPARLQQLGKYRAGGPNSKSPRAGSGDAAAARSGENAAIFRRYAAFFLRGVRRPPRQKQGIFAAWHTRTGEIPFAMHAADPNTQ